MATKRLQKKHLFYFTKVDILFLTAHGWCRPWRNMVTLTRNVPCRRKWKLIINCVTNSNCRWWHFNKFLNFTDRSTSIIHNGTNRKLTMLWLVDEFKYKFHAVDFLLESTSRTKKLLQTLSIMSLQTSKRLFQEDTWNQSIAAV